MSYKIDLGVWGSVFAVPTSVVDKGLRLASEAQLKVLLYILRHNGDTLTDELVSESLNIHPDDVKDAIEYWSSKGLLASVGDTMTIINHIPAEDTTPAELVTDTTLLSGTSVEKQSELPRPVSRPVKPERSYVAKRIDEDEDVSMLIKEASDMLGKMLSQPDMATLIMLHDTDGLPVSVLLMLIQHCVNIGKGNMRYIEKAGIEWAAEGIDTVALADEKITRYSESTSAWNVVSSVFGMKINGSPTKKQLEFGRRWVNEWLFSESMLRLAYEKCVDSKGEVSLSYINGILRKWHEASFKTVDDVAKSDELSVDKKTKKSTKNVTKSASYDLDEYEKKSIFDD